LRRAALLSRRREPADPSRRPRRPPTPLQQLLDRATQPPAPSEGIMRVLLARTRDQLASLPPIDTAISTITEGGGGAGAVNGGAEASAAPSRSQSVSAS
jgi:hypothetical protein